MGNEASCLSSGPVGFGVSQCFCPQRLQAQTASSHVRPRSTSFPPISPLQRVFKVITHGGTDSEGPILLDLKRARPTLYIPRYTTQSRPLAKTHCTRQSWTGWGRSSYNGALTHMPPTLRDVRHARAQPSVYATSSAQHL